MVPAKGGIIGLQVAGITPLDDPHILPALLEIKPAWVRLELIWNQIERSDGTYDWSKTDGLISGLTKNGIQVLAVVDYLPTFLKDWNKAVTRFEKFYAEAIKRYKPGGTLATAQGWGTGGVRYWEIFNEPNLPGYGWGVQGMDTASYVDEYALMLTSANKVLRANDPAGVIMLAGLSPDGLPPDTFWSALYNAGMKNCFDILAVHPYGYFGRFSILEDTLEQYVTSKGDAGKTVWFSEVGTNNDSERADLLNQLATERPKINALIWLSLYDLGNAPGKTYGLMTYDFAKKPDFDLFKSLFGVK